MNQKQLNKQSLKGINDKIKNVGIKILITILVRRKIVWQG